MSKNNKKIRNATKCKSGNLTFKSQLEKSTYNTLFELGFKPQYEYKTYELWSSFMPYTPFYDKETDTYYVTGTIKNTLEDECRNYVNISYNVYDKDGDLLGTANAYIDNLGKGQTWKFKAYYTDIDSKDVVSYKLDTVEHYNDF